MKRVSPAWSIAIASLQAIVLLRALGVKGFLEPHEQTLACRSPF
jgi:hypothetical protein